LFIIEGVVVAADRTNDKEPSKKFGRAIGNLQ
jgi:hypothetical protein